MFLKLGEHASMFFDPTSMVKILPGQVVSANAKQQQSKKLKRARNAGHIVIATQDEYDDYLKSLKGKNQPVGAKPTSADTDEDIDINDMKKPELVNYAFGKLSDDYSKEDLNAMTKAEIIDLLEDLEEEGDDDEE